MSSRINDFKVYYSNTVGAVFNINECRLTFGVLDAAEHETDEDGNNTLEQVSVTMNPLTLKMLRAMIDACIRNIETQAGKEIPIDEARLKEIQDALGTPPKKAEGKKK